MFEGLKDFWREHTMAIIIAIIVIAVVIVIIIVIVIVIIKKKKKESFIEHYVGTDQYTDQYKYAETYVNSVIGI